MKKLFVNPEINSTALTPGDSIMGLFSESNETRTDHSVSDSASLNTAYKIWKGFDNTTE